MNKLIGLMIAVFAIFSASVLAADYAIQSVYLNGYQLSGNMVQVEMGQKVTLDVAVYGYSNSDVRLRAWIGGYEHDLIEDTSEMFDVENGVVEWKHLTLSIPYDMESSRPYTLNLELFDQHNRVDVQYALYVEGKRHDIAVQDIILQPGTSLEAGQTLFAKVRLENMGEKKEEDIRVSLSIESLGISSRNYMDELPKYMADENSGNAPSLYLVIPENAATGDYKAKVTVTYNRGHSETSEEFFVHVNGVSEQLRETKSMVSIESVKEMSFGEENVVKILVANLGKKTSVYSLETAGLEGWADASVNGIVSVAPGQTGELVLKITPNEAGSHAFSVKIKEDGSLVKEGSFNVDVSEEKKDSGLFWILAGILFLVILFAVLASTMFGQKVNHKELGHEF